jgi:hypothetical protein
MLALGVVFDDDYIEESKGKQISDLDELKIFELVKEIESDYPEVCIAILKGIPSSNYFGR